jgi:uncharacterized membrane protein SpoIIM required for sporulation/uncharacterized RDD family membrane protein YckC
VNPPARVPLPPLDLRRRHAIETPEHVEVNLELAGVGSRAAAALVDTVLAAAVLALIAIAAGLLSARGEWADRWAVALLLLLFTFGFFAYFALFEALSGGRTPGKRLLGLRVVMDTGHPVTTTAAALRNLVRLLDCFFPLLPFLPGLLLVFFHKSHKRLGDMAAGTIVVRERPTAWRLGAARADAVPVGPAPLAALGAGPPRLAEAEFRLLDRFVGRLDSLPEALRERTAAELARRFEGRAPRRDAGALAYVLELHRDEVVRRAGRFGTAARRGAVGRTTVTAERFVAQKREGWEAFYGAARHVERTGVGALAGDEVVDFAARYRETAADLARARTYGVDAAVIEYLERLVSAGHNALYRARRPRGGSLARLLLREFPAAVVQSRRQVALAALLLAVPACIGYAMIRQRPDLGEEVMPVMVSRAERAADNAARGVGYAQQDEHDLPLIASAIISNNVLVAFWVFVGGLLAGTLTVWVLVMNGLTLGMNFGLFANYHATGYLGTFVAGHGPLELTAVCIAAGAGFRLAGALLAPGERTRRDALVLEGRIAARMVGAVVTLLALAGTIEGLLSVSDAPGVYKYVASGASLAFLFLYLGNGARRGASAPDAAEAAYPPQPRASSRI